MRAFGRFLILIITLFCVIAGILCMSLAPLFYPRWEVHNKEEMVIRFIGALLFSLGLAGWFQLMSRIERLHRDMKRHLKTSQKILAQAEENILKVQKIEDMLAYLDLHVDTRYVTKQMTTEQKELYADLIDASSDRLAEEDPHMSPPRHVERWWRVA